MIAPAIRRCRPLLGTYVEIAVLDSAFPHTATAITAAFKAVETVHRLMSYQDPDSELSRLAEPPGGSTVRLHPWTANVLRCAQDVARVSGGAFNPAFRTSGADVARDIEWVDTDRVRLRRSIQLDFGGIAKGFAVDRAIERLRDAGVASAVVNAGGDLRVLGPRPDTLLVRDPSRPRQRAAHIPFLCEAAATTAGYFRRSGDGVFCARRRRFLSRRASVTVFAPTAMLADALTKVLWLAREEESRKVLRHFEADGFISYHRLSTRAPCTSYQGETKEEL